MSTNARRRDRGRPRRAHEAPKSAPRSRGIAFHVPPLPVLHPATLIVVLAAAAGLVLSVSFRIMDTDFWQHLVVGKAIWTQHGPPMQHQWTWPWYGTPEVSWVGRSGWSPSWLFRALIWPVWEAGGVTGLFVWRWATTLAAFGFVWAAARAMGARGLSPLFVIVWCSLFYRHRSQIRPETLLAVLLAAELWILSLRRAKPHGERGRDLAWALVPIAWIWANSHISYFLFFVVLAFHLLDEWARSRAFPRRLGLVGAASLAACFVNPYGWQALWAPFAFFLKLRHEVLFQGLGELQPLSLANNQTDGVFVVLVLWPILFLWRWRRVGFDGAEALTCALFTWLMVQSERFFGAYAIVAAVYVARDLDALLRGMRWPRFVESPLVRAAAMVLAIAGIGAAEWARADRPLSVSIDWRRFPVGAMDFIERHGIRGHGFSQTRVAGYQLWRFWPDRDRLPFMDVHQTGTKEDRDRYAIALSRAGGWGLLNRGGRFDYVVLDPWGADSLLAGLDSDTTMALVYLDDGGVVYAKKTGIDAAVADSFGYRFLGGGVDRPRRVFSMVAAATAAEAQGIAVPPAAAAVRPALLAELDRMAASSPRNARANSMIATLAISERRFDDARKALEAALVADPGTPLAHFRLASVELFERRPADAIAQYEQERAIGERPGIDLGIGMAHQIAGDSLAARASFQREMARWPGTPTARAAQQALSGQFPAN